MEYLISISNKLIKLSITYFEQQQDFERLDLSGLSSGKNDTKTPGVEPTTNHDSKGSCQFVADEEILIWSNEACFTHHCIECFKLGYY